MKSKCFNEVIEACCIWKCTFICMAVLEISVLRHVIHCQYYNFKHWCENLLNVYFTTWQMTRISEERLKIYVLMPWVSLEELNFSDVLHFALQTKFEKQVNITLVVGLRGSYTSLSKTYIYLGSIICILELCKFLLWSCFVIYLFRSLNVMLL